MKLSKLLFRLLYNIQKVVERTRNAAKQIWENVSLVFINERQLPHAFFELYFYQ
jgi:hypothetical protein